MHDKKGSDCVYPHPPMCFKYIKRGPKGCAKGTSCNFVHPKLCRASLVSGKCDRNRCYFYQVTGSAMSNHMNATSNLQNKMHGSNYHPTPLMQVSVPPPHVPKPVSNAPQTNTASPPCPNSHIRPPTCTYYFFFRRAKGNKISNVTDATNPESAHAKYAELDVAPFALPKTSSPPKPNVLDNSPIKSNSVCELLILKLQSPSIIIIIIYRPPLCLDCDFFMLSAGLNNIC